MIPVIGAFAIVSSRIVRNSEAIRFAKARGYVVCYRTDTGKPHIAKTRRSP